MIRLALRVRRADAELVLAELLELAPSGVEELDVGDGVMEYAVYGSPGELPHLPDLRAAAGAALVEVATTELPDDWGERWKRFHKAVLIEAPGDLPNLHVRPPWEDADTSAGTREIVIDPGQAFGTGAHATTRLCLELLLALTQRNRAGQGASSGEPPAEGASSEGAPAQGASSTGPLLDVGTGSGVLAIAAAHLGYAPVLALDNDPESVAAAAANAAVNGVSIEVARFDLRHQPLPMLAGTSADGAGKDWPAGESSAFAAQAPVVLANLLRPLLLDLADAIERPPSDLIVGGLLVEQVDEVVGAFNESVRLHERTRRIEGEWAAAWLTRDPSAR